MAKKKTIKRAAKPKKRKVLPRKRITGVRKKPRPRKRVKIGSISQHIAIARQGLENQLADAMLKQYNATTKKAKRQWGKKIAELKTKIRKLK